MMSGVSLSGNIGKTSSASVHACPAIRSITVMPGMTVRRRRHLIGESGDDEFVLGRGDRHAAREGKQIGAQRVAQLAEPSVGGRTVSCS